MFHVVLSGGGFITLAGADPVPLHTGDLILMPHGHVHRLQSERLVPTVKFTDLMVGNPPRKPGLITAGGTGAMTVITCGHLTFDRAELHPLLTRLPPLIHIQGGEDSSQEWLQVTSRLISDEVRTGRMGSAALLDRLGGVLPIAGRPGPKLCRRQRRAEPGQEAYCTIALKRSTRWSLVPR